MTGLKGSNQVIRYCTAKDYTDAISATDAALVTNNNNPDLHYLKGDALEAIGKIQAAAIEYRAAISLNPTENVRQYCERALGAMPVGMADSPMPAQGTIAYNASLAIYNDMNKQAKVHRLYGETEELGLGEEDMIAVIRAIEHRSSNC